MKFPTDLRNPAIPWLWLGTLVIAGCKAESALSPLAPGSAQASAQIADDERFGPLTIGADYRSYRKLTAAPFLSAAHGDRWVDVYVNELGADAYLQGTPVPVGTIVVKESWEDSAGAPSITAGPVFVMRREPPGSTPPEREDWYYAMWWDKPGEPVYLRGNSPKVAFCWEQCHALYYQGLGGLTPSSVLPR
jgi:Cytochrome P460